jgi:outer membrane protein OmpA-like peptidoglycan-associated protein
MSASAQQPDTLYLYFKVSKSELEVQELNKLNRYLEGSSKNIKEIIVSAYADSTGSVANNQILSAKRLEEVKAFLIDAKEALKNHVKSNAMGETSKFGADLQKNRCVELVFVHEEKQGINNLADYVKGDKIVLENILFENNSHVFLPSSLPALQSLLATLKANVTIKIMVLGHVCCGGNNPDYDMIEPGELNMKISETRAKAVCDYLLENGIESDRIKYKGLSFKYPRVFPEKTEEDRAKNRRVEIEIL